MMPTGQVRRELRSDNWISHMSVVGNFELNFHGWLGKSMTGVVWKEDERITGKIWDRNTFLEYPQIFAIWRKILL